MSIEKRKVVITGLGIVSPIGIGVENYWRNLIAGKSGIGPITLFDPVNVESKIAGEVSDYDPLNFMDKSVARRNDRYSRKLQGDREGQGTAG